MKTRDIKRMLADGALVRHSDIYSDEKATRERYLKAITAFEERFGAERDVMLLSVPGRSELLGNHTDHNSGVVLAGAIDRDIIAVVAREEGNAVALLSEGYPMDVVDLSEMSNPDVFPNYTSGALIAGVANGFSLRGYKTGGFVAYTTSDVLKGSGISSSAAYEVMIGNIFNHLYNNGEVANTELARIAQYAENVFFGKPSGLMDQMACAVGGFVYIDFADNKNPRVCPISLDLSEYGYELCIVNTGGNHADLNDDYASVPREMLAVARALGRDVLAGVSEGELIENSAKIREDLGDRAFLRAMHFVRECARVEVGAEALGRGDIDAFFSEVMASGHSSFEYLQNVYTNKNVEEQGLSLALCLTAGFNPVGVGAYRVHGGGFAGTIQAYIRSEYVAEYKALIERVFGEGSLMRLKIRPRGAVRII